MAHPVSRYLDFSKFSDLQTHKIPLPKRGTNLKIPSKDTLIYVLYNCVKIFQIDPRHHSQMQVEVWKNCFFHLKCRCIRGAKITSNQNSDFFKIYHRESVEIIFGQVWTPLCAPSYKTWAKNEFSLFLTSSFDGKFQRCNDQKKNCFM